MRFVRPLREVRHEDLALVGEKSAMLGEVLRSAPPPGIGIPNGFAITADAYREWLRADALDAKIRDVLGGACAGDVHDLVDRSNQVRDLVLRASLPASVREELDAAYRVLSRGEGELASDVAVRASATNLDLSDAAFAGQYESFLNVRGTAGLDEAVRHVFGSLFTPRAIAERIERGIDHLEVAMAVLVQKMVRSDLASAGVIYTADPETGDRARIVLTSAWGLGDSVAQERVVPDRIVLDRNALQTGRSPILTKTIGSKETKVVYDWHGHRQVVTVPVPAVDREHLSCSYLDAIDLARFALAIEAQFASFLGATTAMEIEWAKDGITGTRYVVQARPEAAHARRLARSLRAAQTIEAAS